ncbi:hypothetical protein XA68_16316 [Ophiocordyceps unilateralis]|uniref:Uncharacterized protein n=1 Tax=Ophiocordyceps unilateralis TaxID=268505 RepID=A0A2A9PLK7_OPHUN|nr:hypothetical protein XA68_16316 [Ophiocordyceps unilateralis]
MIDAHPLSRRRRTISMNSSQSLTNAQEEHHEMTFGKSGPIDEIGVNHILQIPAPIIRQQDVDRLGRLIGAAFRRDRMVHGRDDGGDVSEESVRLHLAHRLLDRLGPERASDLLEG